MMEKKQNPRTITITALIQERILQVLFAPKACPTLTAAADESDRGIIKLTEAIVIIILFVAAATTPNCPDKTVTVQNAKTSRKNIKAIGDNYQDIKKDFKEKLGRELSPDDPFFDIDFEKDDK